MGWVSRRTALASTAAVLGVGALTACETLENASTGANADLVVLSVGVAYAGGPNGVSALDNTIPDSVLVSRAFSRIRGASVTTLVETRNAPSFDAAAQGDAAPLDFDAFLSGDASADAAPPRSRASEDIIDFARFRAATDAFIAQAQGKTAVFYYAGHGLQVDGENYLILGDGVTLVPVLPFLDRLSENAEAVVVFFDACRDNPFAAGARPARDLQVRVTRSATRARAFGLPEAVSGDAARQASAGLARLSRGVGEGVMVVFATQAGDVALDRVRAEDANGPFARAVARQVGERRQVTGVVRAIQQQVLRDTDGAQNPVSEDALGGRPVFLAGRAIMPS